VLASDLRLLSILSLAGACGGATPQAPVAPVETSSPAPAPAPVALARCSEKGSDAGRRVGFRCRAAAGQVFEWVHDSTFGNAWKSPDGILWTEDRGAHDRSAAASLCAESGGTLPEFLDYERNYLGGLSELFDLPAKHRSSGAAGFWTKSGAADGGPGVWPIGAHCLGDESGACARSPLRIHCVRETPPSLPLCKQRDENPVGTRCISDELGKSLFVRVEHAGFVSAWQGPDGLVWSAVLAQEVTHEAASALCAGLEARLPTADELERGVSQRFQHVTRPFANDKGALGRDPWIATLWSSSKRPSKERELIGYLNSGATEVTFDHPTPFLNDVVCVAAGEAP
jgi:hypothetical protein